MIDELNSRTLKRYWGFNHGIFSVRNKVLTYLLLKCRNVTMSKLETIFMNATNTVSH